MTRPPALATALSTALVRGHDGAVLGRVRDVYLRDADRDLAAVSVTLGRLGLRTVLVPATAFTVGATDDKHHGMVLRIVPSAGDLRGGIDAPQTLHAPPAMLAEAAEALGVPAPPMPASAPERPVPRTDGVAPTGDEAEPTGDEAEPTGDEAEPVGQSSPAEAPTA